MLKKLNAALVAGVSVVALLGAANPGFAAPAEVYRVSTPEVNIIVIDGDIDHDTPTKVRYALKMFNNRAGFVIDSLGGSMLAAREIQQMVIGVGPDSKVTVPAYGICASACVDILIAAATPQARSTSRIGVHMGLAKSGAAVPDQFAAKLYRVRGVPETVITKMNSTPPSSLYWVSGSEFQAIPGARVLTDRGMTVGEFIQQAQYRVGLN
jgi:hypothetical protein